MNKIQTQKEVTFMMNLTFNHNTTVLPLKFYDIGLLWEQHKVYRPEGFTYFHWLQTDTGTGIINIENQEIQLSAHQGFLMRPNIPHSFFPDSNKAVWKTSFLTFEGSAAAEVADFLALNDFQLYNNLDPELDQFISLHYQDFQKTDFESKLTQSELIYHFLMLLKQNAHHNQLLFSKNPVANTLMDFIRNHYSEVITNESLSKISGYSPSHTIKIFRDEFKVTPLEYLNTYRLRIAKSLLKFRSDLSIGTIATLVGFANTSYFVRQFKGQFGATPGKYRK